MKRLPFRSDPIVVRTAFANQRVWASIKRSILAGQNEDDDAAVAFVDDREFDGLSKRQVVSAVPKDYPQTFLMLVDSVSIAEKGHPVLVVSLRQSKEFRALAKTIHSVASNLAIANLGFDDFIRAAGAEGVFKGA